MIRFKETTRKCLEEKKDLLASLAPLGTYINLPLLFFFF